MIDPIVFVVLAEKCHALIKRICVIVLYVDPLRHLFVRTVGETWILVSCVFQEIFKRAAAQAD